MNKLLARIVAVCMAVAMLGTVSFAASMYSDGAITPDDVKEEVTVQATKTVLAFVSETATATAPAENSDIIAIVQDISIPATISIDKSKIGANDKYIIVLFGGSDGETDSAAIALDATTELATITVKNEITFGEGEDAVTYQNVVYGDFSYTPTAGKTITEMGIRFESSKSESTPHDVTKDISSVTGTGEITFSALIIGVPAEAQSRVTATPYVVER